MANSMTQEQINATIKAMRDMTVEREMFDDVCDIVDSYHNYQRNHDQRWKPVELTKDQKAALEIVFEDHDQTFHCAYYDELKALGVADDDMDAVMSTNYYETEWDYAPVGPDAVVAYGRQCFMEQRGCWTYSLAERARSLAAESVELWKEDQ